MDTKFENIVPWNGSNDTGRDVRLKWERNFKRIADALKELSDTDKQIIKDILKEIDKIFLHKDKEDGTNYLLKFGEFIDSMVAGKGAGIFPDAARSLNALKSAIPLPSLSLSSTVSPPWRATIPSPSPVPSKVYRNLKTAHTA